MPAPLSPGVQATDRSFKDADSLTSVQYSRKPDKRPLVVRWRSAVLSPDGPKSPTTRFVLVALSNHMWPDGDRCYPSIATLSKETAFSPRVVGLHLHVAVEAGWITRKRRATGNTVGYITRLNIHTLDYITRY